MGRRPITEMVRCAESGCGEHAYYEHASQREAAESRQWRAKFPYRCSRHMRPGEVLGVEQQERVGVLEVYEESYGRFWRSEHDKSGSGSAFGPGFKAFAKDFPPGTRLIVTARVELPVGVEDKGDNMTDERRCPHDRTCRSTQQANIASTGVAYCRCCGNGFNAVVRKSGYCRPCDVGDDHE